MLIGLSLCVTELKVGLKDLTASLQSVQAEVDSLKASASGEVSPAAETEDKVVMLVNLPFCSKCCKYFGRSVAPDAILCKSSGLYAKGSTLPMEM